MHLGGHGSLDGVTDATLIVRSVQAGRTAADADAPEASREPFGNSSGASCEECGDTFDAPNDCQECLDEMIEEAKEQQPEQSKPPVYGLPCGTCKHGGTVYEPCQYANDVDCVVGEWYLWEAEQSGKAQEPTAVEWCDKQSPRAIPQLQKVCDEQADRIADMEAAGALHDKAIAQILQRLAETEEE